MGAEQRCRRVVRAPDVVWRVLPDRVLVLRIGEPDAVELVGVAALAWVGATDPMSVADLAEELSVEFASLHEAIDVLVDRGWLDVV